MRDYQTIISQLKKAREVATKARRGGDKLWARCEESGWSDEATDRWHQNYIREVDLLEAQWALERELRELIDASGSELYWKVWKTGIF